jgi:histidine triad (HIT) family protein
MEDCIFCKIVAKEIPSDIVLENSEFLAFHDINPKAPVHILIIPKSHYDSFQDIPPVVMANMTPFVQEVATKLGVAKSGYRLITNIGKNGGQEVGHIHFHLLGGAKLKWGHFSDSNPQGNL